uniref:Uncharacterized protein n=1 Tax=Romanomermis culicivorax TaxID=13658 RepID=A0A915KRQ4_ROMCU
MQKASLNFRPLSKKNNPYSTTPADEASPSTTGATTKPKTRTTAAKPDKHYYTKQGNTVHDQENDFYNKMAYPWSTNKPIE